MKRAYKVVIPRVAVGAYTGPCYPGLLYIPGRITTAKFWPGQLKRARNPKVSCAPGINVFESLETARQWRKIYYKILLVRYDEKDLLFRGEDKTRVTKVFVVGPIVLKTGKLKKIKR